MAVDREGAYQALFTRLSGSVTGTYATRDYHHRNDASFPQPALLVLTTDQVPVREANRPSAWHLRAHVLVYHTFTAADSPRSSVMNRYLDQVEAALRARPDESATGQTTLGGQVVRAWISSASLYEYPDALGATLEVVVEMVAA